VVPTGGDRVAVLVDVGPFDSPIVFMMASRFDEMSQQVFRARVELQHHDYFAATAQEDLLTVGVLGSNLEASILTATVCLGFETPEIWAKAISEPHAKILSQLGVHHIVRPEHDMGKRVAHLVAGRMMDYMEFEDGYAMVKTSPPSAILGQSLSSTDVRKRYGVTIVAIKRPGEAFTYAMPETVVNRAT
jgi:Trk K+ transport system NAD-binding subunit